MSLGALRYARIPHFGIRSRIRFPPRAERVLGGIVAGRVVDESPRRGQERARRVRSASAQTACLTETAHTRTVAAPWQTTKTRAFPLVGRRTTATGDVPRRAPHPHPTSIRSFAAAGIAAGAHAGAVGVVGRRPQDHVCRKTEAA